MDSDRYLSSFPRSVVPGAWLLQQDLLATLSLYGIFTVMVALVGVVSFVHPVFSMSYSTWWSAVLLMLLCHFFVVSASPIPDFPKVVSLFVIDLLLYCTFISRIYVHSKAIYLCMLGVVIGTFLLSQEALRANELGPPWTANEVTERYLREMLRSSSANKGEEKEKEEEISCAGVNDKINVRHLIKLLSYYNCHANPNTNGSCDRVDDSQLSPLTRLGFDPTDTDAKTQVTGFLATCTPSEETKELISAVEYLHNRPTEFKHILTDPRRYFVYDTELVSIDTEYSSNSLFWSTYTNNNTTGWLVAVFEGCLTIVNYSYMFLFLAIPMID